MKRISKSLAETDEIAGDFLEFLDEEGKVKGFQEGAQIAGLFGDLGAGKTAFVQAVGRILGIKENITSPTFVIMKSYGLAVQPPRFNRHGSTARSDAPRWEKLIHIDAYRLKSGEELMKLDFEEIANDPENLILIEWPENVESALPKNFHKVYFKFVDENTREIEINSKAETYNSERAFPL